jgi:hypothetical protein
MISRNDPEKGLQSLFAGLMTTPAGRSFRLDERVFISARVQDEGIRTSTFVGRAEVCKYVL